MKIFAIEIRRQQLLEIVNLDVQGAAAQLVLQVIILQAQLEPLS